MSRGGQARAPRLLALVVFALVLGLGCAPEEPPPGEAQVELGTGSWRFEPVTDGAEVPLIRGAQGGWHFWLSARASGMTDDTPTLAVEVQLADDSRPAQRWDQLVSLERPSADGTRAVVGLTAIMSDPGCLAGQMVRVRVTLTGAGGVVLTDERYLVIGPGADPPPACGEEMFAPG